MTWLGQENFLFSKLSRLVLEPTQPLFNAYRCSCPRIKRLGRAVGHTLHLVPSVRMTAAVPLFPLYASWRARDKFLVFQYFKILFKKKIFL
jgi:hypothetical protein